MVKYLSGRVKRTPQDQLKEDRYQYLNLEQAEPNLSDPLAGPTPPPGGQYQLIAIPGYPGQRFWVPVVGGYNLEAGELLVKTTINHGLSNGDTIRIIDNGIIFSCSMDNRETEHSYPRVTDPASDAELSVTQGAAGGYNTANTFVVNVGESYSGGYFAPLEMELIASILENSTG